MTPTEDTHFINGVSQLTVTAFLVQTLSLDRNEARRQNPHIWDTGHNLLSSSSTQLCTYAHYSCFNWNGMRFSRNGCSHLVAVTTHNCLSWPGWKLETRLFLIISHSKLSPSHYACVNRGQTFRIICAMFLWNVEFMREILANEGTGEKDNRCVCWPYLPRG